MQATRRTSLVLTMLALGALGSATLPAPPNQSPEDAAVIETLPYRDKCFEWDDCVPDHPLWWRYTPPRDMWVRIDVNHDHMSPKPLIYVGTPSDLQKVACAYMNEDHNRAACWWQADLTYFIRVQANMSEDTVLDVWESGPHRLQAFAGDFHNEGRDRAGWYEDGWFALQGKGPGTLGDRQHRYGRIGDVAVVGDWNGDGRDTLGVRRGKVWLLRDYNSKGSATYSFSFGRAGDVPLVGDWNGDGRDTVGVRRGKVWLLRNRNSAGPADLSFAYGRAGDVPVVGDWNGDGRDTVGVRRGKVWLLRNRNSAGPAHLSFAYGRASDLPVVGDWNRDGRDSVGVVRLLHADSYEGEWLLRNRNSAGAAHISYDFIRPFVVGPR